MKGYLDISGEGGLVKLGDLLDALDALRAEGSPVTLGERYERVDVSVNTSDGTTLHGVSALRIRLPIRSTVPKEMERG